MTSFIFSDRCPICGSSFLIDTEKVGLSGSGVIELGDMEFPSMAVCRYRVCMACGTYIQSPRLSDEDVAHMYSSGVYRDHMMRSKPDEIVEDEKRRATSVMLDVKEKPKSHLDIGSSSGVLLDMVDADEQAAVEPDANHRGEGSYKIFESIDEVSGQFKLITIMHVLEHVVNPVKFLRRAAELLHPTGRMIVEVPSEFSPGGWPRIPHLYHFPPWSLLRIAHVAGLSPVAIGYTPHLRLIAERSTNA